MIAAASGHTDLVSLLLKHGADANVRDKAGNTCLSLATKKGHNRIVNLILNGFEKRTKRKPKPKAPETVAKSCEICDENFTTESSYKKHLSSTNHRFKVEQQESNGKVKAYYGIPKTNRGFQLMLKDGWDADTGLGPEGHGKLYPVKTILKRNRHGFGLKDEKPKVTHFGPSDPASVASLKKRPERALRTGTAEKRKRASKLKSETSSEINFRREFL